MNLVDRLKCSHVEIDEMGRKDKEYLLFWLNTLSYYVDDQLKEEDEKCMMKVGSV